MSQIPASDVDLYTESARTDPYEIYARLRDLGPVVHLSRYDLYALPRYDEVRTALMDWQTFSSARGVFVDPDVNAQLEGITLCSDPPEHTAMRSVLGRPLRPDRMREVTPRIEAEADQVVERVVGRGRFEVVTELAEYLPMTVVSDLVGLPDHGREKMLEWAAAARPSRSSWHSPRMTPCREASTPTAGRRSSTRPPTVARSRTTSAR